MSTTQGYSFPKSARLTSSKAIAALYESGRRRSARPLRYVVRVADVENDVDRGVKVLVSVPKKLFKHAVDRNKLKRRIREAYRLRYRRLELVAEQQNLAMSIGIMYANPAEVEFKTIDDAMEKIISEIEKDSQKSDDLSARGADLHL